MVCEDLWRERNTIFAIKGYCFKSERARAAFGEGCFQPFGKLSADERARVNAIRQQEAANGCASQVTPAPAEASQTSPEMPLPDSITADPETPHDNSGALASVAVLVGGDAEVAACSSGGETITPAGSAETSVSVHNGPDGTYSALESIPVGSKGYICDRQGEWLGIVYSNDDKSELSEACGVEAPWPSRMPYSGPCRSGWVRASHFKQTSG